MPHRVLRIVAAACLAVCFAATCARTAAQRFSFEPYGRRGGLKNINVRSMLQDREGLLWFGTEGGLFRFDGFRFEAIPIPGAESAAMVLGLVEDRSGRIWFSTTDALGYFDGKAARTVPGPGQGFVFALMNTLAADADHANGIYLVSRHQLYSARIADDGQPQVSAGLSPEQMKLNPELGDLHGLTVLPGAALPGAAPAEEKIWLGCGKGICLLEGGKVRVYAEADGLPAEPWRRLYADRNKVLWARSEHHLVWLDASGHFSDITRGPTAAQLSVRTPEIGEDPQGRLLVNLSDGMGRFDHGTWTLFKQRVDLPPEGVNAMLVDRQGSVWLGLDGHGPVRWLGYDQWESLTTGNGLSSNVVWSFLRDHKGDLWLATESDLERMQHGSRKIEPQRDERGAPLQRIQTITLTSNGHIWSGSDNGKVIDYDPESHKARLVAQLGGVFQILHGDGDELWISAMSGLYRAHSGRAGGVERLAAPAPQGHVFEGVRDAAGNYWFVADTGLYRLAGSQWTQMKLPANYRTAFSSQIALAGDQTIWLSGVSPALIHLRVEGDAMREIEHFDSPPLSSGVVYLAALDRRGWLWVGTDAGVDVYNGHEWRHPNSDDGLVWNDVNSSAFMADDDGSVWIGTSGGAAHLLRPESLFHSEPLSIYLSHVAIGSTDLQASAPVALNWSREPLTALLSTLDFAHAHQVTFRYRVDGIGEDWQASPKHDLRYPPLAPGHYRLDVIAVDAINGRQSKQVSVAFFIRPPWWRTNLFYSICVLAIVLAIAALWRWSMRRHIARQKRLEALVRSRTIELEMEKTELLRARAALEEQATHDSLTGMLNRGAILAALDVAMMRCAREGTALGVVLADLDHFKSINDTYGHLAGDDVLRECARRLKTAIRAYDSVGRYGGEEILILLPGLLPEMAMERLAHLHGTLCGAPFACGQRQIGVTCSFGFTWFVPGSDTIESMLERADRAMYMAKQKGRNRIESCEVAARRAENLVLSPNQEVQVLAERP